MVMPSSHHRLVIGFIELVVGTIALAISCHQFQKDDLVHDVIAWYDI